MVQTIKIALSLIALSLVATACAQSGAPPQLATTTIAPVTTIAPTSTVTTTVVVTTTVPPSTTTTATPGPDVFDTINGVEPDSPELMNRGAVTIKIDNHPNARPQAGLMEADLVYEMLVEGGLTRFAAVFHQSDVDWVGPVRSGRVTDIGAVRWLDGPLQVSGAQGWVQVIFRREGLRVLYDSGASTWREDHRSAPHNLYSSSYKLRDQRDSLGWPDENHGNAFEFGTPTEGGDSATDITFGWSNSPDINWHWNGTDYERYNGDEPHRWVTEATKTEAGEIVTTPMMVVITGDVRIDEGPGGYGSPIPTTETKGTGSAYVFRDGTVIEGMWERAAYVDTFTLTTNDGRPIVLPPSKMWVIIFPENRTVTWE